MGLIAMVTSIFTSRKASSNKTLWDFAGRAANGDKFSDKDAAALADALAALGKSPGDFQEIVALHKEKAALESRAKEKDAAWHAFDLARKAVEARRAKLEVDLRTAAAEIEVLRTEQGERQDAFDTAHRAERALAALLYAHADIFGYSPPDMNTITPACKDETIMCDPRQPVVEVARKGFHAECDRRARLFDLAVAEDQLRATREYEAYGQKWRGMSGCVRDDAPPAPKQPRVCFGWVELLAMVKSGELTA